MKDTILKKNRHFDTIPLEPVIDQDLRDNKTLNSMYNKLTQGTPVGEGLGIGIILARARRMHKILAIPELIKLIIKTHPQDKRRPETILKLDYALDTQNPEAYKAYFLDYKPISPKITEL